MPAPHPNSAARPMTGTDRASRDETQPCAVAGQWESPQAPAIDQRPSLGVRRRASPPNSQYRPHVGGPSMVLRRSALDGGTPVVEWAAHRRHIEHDSRAPCRAGHGFQPAMAAQIRRVGSRRNDHLPRSNHCTTCLACSPITTSHTLLFSWTACAASDAAPGPPAASTSAACAASASPGESGGMLHGVRPEKTRQKNHAVRTARAQARAARHRPGKGALGVQMLHSQPKIELIGRGSVSIQVQTALTGAPRATRRQNSDHRPLPRRARQLSRSAQGTRHLHSGRRRACAHEVQEPRSIEGSTASAARAGSRCRATCAKRGYTNCCQFPLVKWGVFETERNGHRLRIDVTHFVL